MVVAQLGQPRAFALRVHGGAQYLHLFGQPAARRQGVGDILEGALDGALIAGHGLVAPHFGQVEVGAAASRVEDRQVDAGREIPGAAAAAEQAVQFGAGAAERARQRDARKEGGARRADVGVGGTQLVFGGDDVGPIGQQVRRQPGRQVAHDAVVVQAGARQRLRQWLAGQQFQRMGLRGAGLFQVGAKRARLLPERLDLGQVQLRDRAHLVAPAEDAQRLLARGDGCARQRQPLIQFAQRQVAVGHLRDQAQRGGFGGGVRGQVVFQRGVLEAAHAAPEVQFPGRHAHADLVLAGHLRLAGEVQVAGRAAAAAVRLRADRGELVGALDAVEGPRFLDPQQRRAQVAVVRQGVADQALQHGIGEVAAPVDPRRAWQRGVGRGGLAGIDRRHWRRGPDVLRRHRHAAWRQQYGQGGRRQPGGAPSRKGTAVHAHCSIT